MLFKIIKTSKYHIGIEIPDRQYEESARYWSEKLINYKHSHGSDTILHLSSKGLGLKTIDYNSKPIYVNFMDKKITYRRLFGGKSVEMLAKAVGVQQGVRPKILDATAGLGKDAFLLVSLGCPITLIERQPIINALLEDGLNRATKIKDIRSIIVKMELLQGDSIDFMSNWKYPSPQVIYLDPISLVEERKRRVKKEMMMLRSLVGSDTDASSLLEKSLLLATHRVVVKRLCRAPCIPGPRPSYALTGTSIRFDIYSKKKLCKL